MSTTPPELMQNCKRCSHPLALGALVCERCHTLVHSEELERLAAEAKALESKGESQRARETWLTALQLLPSTSTQAEWIKQHIQQLRNTQLDDSQRLQPLVAPGPITLPAAKSPSNMRVQLTSLLSFAAFIAIYSFASGVRFGIGFAVLILIHEMGHFIDIKRRGLPADMPVFLPGLGAYVRWQAMGVPQETRSAVSLAGPLAGFFASLACAVLWWQTHDPLWASLARSGAILNVLNLIPVWVLDGGQAVLALSKIERIALIVVSVALGLALGQRMFFLVALGFGYQAFFAGHLPVRPSRATTIYFAAVLAALGVLIWLMPRGGLGLD